jgi:polyhydroxyalkanoate synthase
MHQLRGKADVAEIRPKLLALHAAVDDDQPQGVSMTASDEVTEAALDAVAATEPAPALSIGSVADGVAATLLQGSAIARAGVELGAEAARIALGRSELAPDRTDWRFKDPTWATNPLYKRLAQTYLAVCSAVDSVLVDLEATASAQRVQRARFATGIVTSAIAPTNALLGNPAAIKRTFETGGANLVSGVEHWLSDLRSNGGMPSTAKPGALKVGEDLALTPGAVVDMDDRAELLQYSPTTEAVRARPMLVVPPPIGRFYFLDLSPGRSFVEYAVGRGLQTFLLSWRNPGKEHSDWDIDTYAERILLAIDAVREVTGSEDVNVVGFCAGGILNTAVLNHLAASNDQRVHSASYAVTLLDFGQSAPIGAFYSAKLLSLARWNSSRAGVISARAMGSAFTWMRPNDLVWNYWVNNYLMGEDPPVFDILSWNADGTNLPATLHRQFLDIFEQNPLPQPGAMKALGTPIDLRTIKLPTYVVGARNDHLTPWKSCFRTTQMLSGESTFSLSNAGHIASLVNPPGNPKSNYYTAPLDLGASPDEWFEQAESHVGSWWEHWADWALKRSGEQIPTPKSLGSSQFPALGPAPGTYVRRKD